MKISWRTPAALLLLSITLMACYSKPYFDRNGKKMRFNNEAVDEWYADSAAVAAYAFDIKNYLDTATLNNKQTQFVLPNDVIEIAHKTPKLLVIIFNPECGGSSRDLKLAKFAEDNNMPYILLSNRFSPSYIDRYIKWAGLKNGNRYVIPSGHYFSHILLKKHGQFWSKVAPEVYQKYKDELVNVSYMILKQGEIPIVNVDNQYPNYELAKQWLEGNW